MGSGEGHTASFYTVLLSNGTWGKCVLILRSLNIWKRYDFIQCKETDGQVGFFLPLRYTFKSLILFWQLEGQSRVLI